MGVEVGDLRPEERDPAVEVLARGMRDNPLHVAAFGDDPERRERGLRWMFGALFRVRAGQPSIVARDGEKIVGVTGVAVAQTCQPSTFQGLRILPAILRSGPRAAARVAGWTSAWAKHDPEEPHSHLGPLAVDAGLQGRGIGSSIMREYCRRLDVAGDLGYLETDRPENVPFYERFGFATVAAEEVIGVPNWYMQREPGARAER